jgi:hypothetical protein
MVREALIPLAWRDRRAAKKDIRPQTAFIA